MRLAYLTPQYPKVSHTFIRREIHALEAFGHHITRVSVRGTPASVVIDPADQAEVARTRVLLRSPLHLAMCCLRMLLRAPVSFVRSLAESIRIGVSAGNGIVKPIAYFVEACALRQICDEDEIEHVHVHFGTNAANVAWLLKRLGGPTYSLMIHGPDEWDAPERHLLGTKMSEASFTALISSYACGQARRWLACDHWDGLKEVHCTVDDSFFDSAAPIEPGDRLRLVCVGRLTAQKGQLLLVDAVAEAVAAGVDVELVLAGDGEMRAEVEERIAARDLGARIRITGWIDEAEVRVELLRAHCFILPSFAEGLPVVIMEAFALGRPVLSTFVAGIPELVQPGENGWLVPCGDVGALANAIVDVSRTPFAELERMGKAGAARVRERHSARIEARKLEALFRSAACEGR